MPQAPQLEIPTGPVPIGVQTGEGVETVVAQLDVAAYGEVSKWYVVQEVIVVTAGVLQEEAFVVPATGVPELVQAVQVPLPLLVVVPLTGVPVEVQTDQVAALLLLVPFTGVAVEVIVVMIVVVVEMVWQTGVPGMV